MDYSIDAGSNIFTLGLAYLALKFLLPLVIGLILVGLAYFLLKDTLPEIFQNSSVPLLGLLALIVVIIALSL